MPGARTYGLIKVVQQNALDGLNNAEVAVIVKVFL